MLKPGEWEAIIDNLSSGKTIICLGPELFVQGDSTLDEQLRAQLRELDNVSAYADGLFHFRGAGDMTSYTRIKQFYGRPFPEVEPLLQRLAALPAPVFICMTPDTLLKKAFVQQAFSFQYDFHYPNRPAREIQPPTAEEPLLYNLLGDTERRESMVLTHEDLFVFLESVMEGKSISRVLKEQINAAYNFIFIGLPFGRWYMKILVHFLQKDANRKALKYAANHAFDEEIQAFMVDQFQIICVPARISEFVGELHRRCAEAGHLRATALSAPVSTFDKWTRMVMDDQLDELLEDMVAWFSLHRPEDRENMGELFNLNGRFSSLDKMQKRGTISLPDAQLQRNQIRDTILDFLHDVVKPLQL